MDPSAACRTSRPQNFPFPTSQCPKVKRCFNLEIACSQTSSPPPAMSSTPTPTMPWYFVVPQDQNTRFQDGCLEPQTSGCSQETVPPFSRAVCQSTDCLEQLHPNTTRFSWDSIRRHSDEEWFFPLDRVSSVKRLLYIPKLQLGSMAPHGLQDCHKALTGKCRRK